jgi:uncharacterized membrane protein YeaQ/YmgE (transglycosylase-associated protein family)
MSDRLSLFGRWRGYRKVGSPVEQTHVFRKDNTMHFIWSLIVGLIVGALAKLIMPGRDPGGILITMLIGIAGSVLAGFLGRAMGLYQATNSGPGIIASVIGAIILLAGYRMIRGRRTT